MILARLLIKEIAIHAAIATLAGVSLFVIVDFVEVSNLAIERVHTSDLLALSWYGIPNMLRRVLLVTAPVGAITALGAMVRRSELVAAFSAGASPSVVLRPVLAIGVLIALLFAIDVELLVPPSYPTVNAIRRQLELAESPLDDPGRQTWFKGARQLYHVQSLLGEGGRLLGGVMMLSVQGGRLLERWDADRLSYEGGAWIGQGVLHRAPKDEGTLLTERFERHQVPISEVPDDFVNGIAPPASLRLADLHRVTLARERLGSPALAHRVELYQRFTGPPVLLLLIALAAALALRLPRKHSMAVALGTGAAIGFLGWYLREFERLFAAMGNVSPLWAAGLVPALLGAVTVWAWLRVGREGIVERS